jgi:putative ABC transport system permease protein
MSLTKTILTAVRALGANKLRAFLTTLGIIIGVASVIAMLALGNGARAAVEANFRSLGSDVIQVNAAQKFKDGELQNIGEILSYEDGLLMAGEVELVKRVEMSVSRSGKVRHDRYVLDLTVSGVTPDALASQVVSQEYQPVGWPEGEPLSPDAFIESGRFLTQTEVMAVADVCVIGHETAEELFEGEDPIDQTVWVNRHRCLVIGVIAEVEHTDPERQRYSNPNETFFMPISTAIRVLYDDEPSVSVIARVTDESRMGEAKDQISDYLRERHHIEMDGEGKYTDDFNLITRGDVLGAQQEAARTFSFLLAAMAAVSLVVGGIGIMNVMLVSVTERTREIGVRMAVGARQRDIMSQFLTEAMLISAGGGLLGISVGVLSIPLAASLNDGVALLAPFSMPLAFGVAVLAGVLFGLYPAFRAAHLDPIEALRYE